MSGNGSGSLNTARSPFPGSRARVAVLSVLAVALLVAVGFVIRESSLPAGGHRGPAVRQRQTIETRYESGDRDLDGLQQLFRPALEANHKQISGRLGVVRGFGAGDAYPQIWVRDSATILQLSRWLYPREELTSWVEELLAAQKPDGGIVDWIAAGAPERFVEWAPRAHAVFEVGSTTLTADTNTTEADQESSMVQAVHLVYQATSDDRWLKKRIMGTPIIERTEAALSSLARRRRDARTGLISSAFTADWGDVSPLYPDQRAIYLDDRTPVVVGLYTNAMYCRAAVELAGLLDAVGERNRAQSWRDEADRIRKAVNHHLWQQRRGFYRMHRVITPGLVDVLPDDDDIFALGGHAAALLAGIADEKRAARVVEVAEQRRREYGFATLGASLLAPYPAGTFAHPAMREEWRYQNGGQWDWFAGRFVLAEFRLGYSERALAHLLALARRARAAGGIYEWYERDGTGRGSPRYAAGAAALANAVLGGLFGITLDAGGASLDVRLGGRNGAVEVREPTSGRTLAYRQQVNGPCTRLVLQYSGTVSGRGKLRVRLPPGSIPGQVWRDGAAVAAREERTGNDTFVALDTDWGMHRLEVDLLREGSRKTPGMAPAVCEKSPSEVQGSH